MTPGSPAVVHHLWQSTLFVALVWLAALALRNNRARVRYWLWAAASLKFLIPVSWLVTVGQRIEWHTAPAAAQLAGSFLLEEILAPEAMTIAMPVSPSYPLSVVPWLIGAVWMAGACVVLLRWWRQWTPIRSALRHATPVRLDAQDGIPEFVVMASPSIVEPGLVGIRRPVLLLPRGLAERLAPAHLRALIAHERCHARCHDNLVATVHMAVEAVFWFHPLAWWIGARMIDERERACDEEVLRFWSRPCDYAEGILEVCRSSVESSLACVSGVSGSNLRRRVESIMRNEMGRPLTLERRVGLALGAAAIIAGPIAVGALSARPSAVRLLQQRATPALLEFEAASIKPNKSGQMRVSARWLPGGGYEGFNITLRSLVQQAYGLPEYLVLGGPDWLQRDRYDVLLKAPADSEPSPPDAFQQRLRSLLAERMKMRVHRETRDVPIYALVVARRDGKLGPSITTSTIDCDSVSPEAAFRSQGRGDAISITLRDAGPRLAPCTMMAGGGRMIGSARTMAEIARSLQGPTGRVVEDRTGLPGRFDFTLMFTRDPNIAAAPFGGGLPSDGVRPPADPDALSIFTALQEQLGIKLESTRGVVAHLLIDSADRPAQN